MLAGGCGRISRERLFDDAEAAHAAVAAPRDAMYIHRVKKAMVRKQVYLTAEQNERLRRAAARERRTEAEILRDALDSHLGATERSAAEIRADPLWEIVGVGESEEGDLSERVDDILYGSGGA